MPSARLARILRRLDRIEHALDLDNDGLGDRLIDAAVAVMERDFDRGVAPDGSGWPELSPEYLRWKATHALTTAMGYLEGAMATSAAFSGERSISAGGAAWTFGETDRERQEADWFINGDPARNRPPRPFVGLSEEAKAAVRETIAGRLRAVTK